MSAAATIPADVPAWTVHPEHVRAAVNIVGLSLGVTEHGEVLVNTDAHLRRLGAVPICGPERLDRLFADNGATGAAGILTVVAGLFRGSPTVFAHP